MSWNQDLRDCWRNADETTGAGISFGVIFLARAYFGGHVLLLHLRRRFGL